MPRKLGTVLKNGLMRAKNEISGIRTHPLVQNCFFHRQNDIFESVPNFVGMFFLFFSGLSHKFKTMRGHLDLSRVLSEM